MTDSIKIKEIRIIILPNNKHHVAIYTRHPDIYQWETNLCLDIKCPNNIETVIKYCKKNFPKSKIIFQNLRRDLKEIKEEVIQEAKE